MEKAGPNYSSWIIVLCVVLSGYFFGDLACLFVRKHVQTPPSLHITRAAARETAAPKTAAQLSSEAKPLFPVSATPHKTGSSSTSGDALNWDEILSDKSKVKLNGTIIGAGISVAYLTIGAKDVALFKGAPVGSFRVGQVGRSFVEFVRGNEKRVISLNLEGGSGGGEVAVSTHAPIPDLPPIPSAPGPIAGKSILSRKMFDSLVSNPGEFAGDIRFTPISQDNKPSGIKVSYLKPGSFFSRLGMIQGDVIKKINDKDIKTPEDTFNAYQTFKNEDNLQIEINRGGKDVPINVEFR